MPRIASVVCLAILLFGGLADRAISKDRFERVEPEAVGFSSARLAELEAFLAEYGSSSMLLIRDGKVFFEYGDIYRKHTVHSIRKALLNSLYGIYIGRGVIDTTRTVGDLGIDDIPPELTDDEKAATIADLLKSRSGIYHEAAAEAPSMITSRPKRGTHKPGEDFYYNNWDFNVLGRIFENLADESIYKAFKREIAEPLGMLHYDGKFATIEEGEDVEIADVDGFYQYERSRSRYPAYHFRMSTYDLALYGSLFVNNGRWEGEQIIPEAWIERSTKAYSVTNGEIAIGYGMLWRVLMPNAYRKTGSYFHTGAGVHMLGVYPSLKLVFVHRVDTERDYNFESVTLIRIISMMFDSMEQ